jgi:hypothetical protein
VVCGHVVKICDIWYVLATISGQEKFLKILTCGKNVWYEICACYIIRTRKEAFEKIPICGRNV